MLTHRHSIALTRGIAVGGSVTPDYLRFRSKGLWFRAGKRELHGHYTFDCGSSKACESEPIFAHIHDLPRERLSCLARKLDRKVNLVAKISAVLACHFGNRCIEKASQLPIVNRFAEYEIGSASTAILTLVAPLTTATTNDALLDDCHVSR